MTPDAGPPDAGPAAAWLRARLTPLRLVIFDCDGVLIDSEPVANRVTAAEISRLGYPMAATECAERFLGMSLADMCRVIPAEFGIVLPPGWDRLLASALVAALAREAALMPGAEAALRGTSALGLTWRVASNSGVAELAAKFACVGLAGLVADRVWSAETVIARGGHGKPAPDLFLAVADAAGVEPAACLVIEDSLAGIRGARAAGMGCLGFCPQGAEAPLVAAGAVPLHELAGLPDLLRLAMDGPR